LKARTLLAIVLTVTLALFLVPHQQFARASSDEGTSLALPAGYDFLSDELQQQTEVKFQKQDRLKELSKAPGTRMGELPDISQVSLAAPMERGILTHPEGTRAAYAYVQPYQEPNEWGYRNYCAVGAAIVLLSHWDPQLPQNADVDQFGQEIGVDPNLGAWVTNIVDPVNRRVNDYLGEEVNWYIYGRAETLRQFRWMLNLDIMQNAVPLITGVMTGGLPGWGPRNVGHFVAVYGYTRMPDGSEWVSYADTASPIVDYYDYTLHVWELGDFWRAVSANSGQVW
jgi:hypothetical protein